SSKQDLKDLETRLLGEIERLRRDMNEMKTGLKRDMEELETGLRRDMNEMKTGLKRDMEELETGLRRDMKDLEYRMTIKLGSLMVIAVGSMAALVKLL
ncbi:MAG TPA: hypothetical protein VNL74_01380, partial [Methylococcus sp.]|nr:hypothetical protein [Methylococcus sp.]